MSNKRKIECKIKPRSHHLTEWQRRELSETIRDLCFSYDLEYIIVTRNQK